MKRFRRCAVIVLALAMTMMMSISSFAYTNVIGKSGSKGANIREHATTSSDVVGSIAPNTEFTICGEVKDSAGVTWYFVFVDSKKTGYIRSDVVTNTGVPAGGETDDNAAGSGGGTTTPDQGNDEPVAPPSTGGETTITPSDCTLSSIIFQDGFLEPEFEPGVYEYTLTVENEITSVAVSATTTDDTSVIEGSVGFDNLEVGINDRYITVKGADGNTAVYHFSVVRGEAGDASGADTPEQAGDADSSSNTTDKTDSATKKNSGASKIVIVLLVIVIVGLMVVIVFMALQMRDMKEQIEMLEREKRRRRKKAQEAHRIASGNEKDNNGSSDKSGVRREVTSVKPSGPAFEKPVRLNIQPEMVPPHKRDLRMTPGIEPITAKVEEEYPEVQYSEPQVEEMQFEDTQYADTGYQEEAFSVEPNAEIIYTEEQDMAELSGTEAYKKEQYQAMEQEMPQEEPYVDETEEMTAKVMEQENDSWKSVNFLAPEDDMEFEFLNLDDDDKLS